MIPCLGLPHTPFRGTSFLHVTVGAWGSAKKSTALKCCASTKASGTCVFHSFIYVTSALMMSRTELIPPAPWTGELRFFKLPSLP